MENSPLPVFFSFWNLPVSLLTPAADDNGDDGCRLRALLGRTLSPKVLLEFKRYRRWSSAGCENGLRPMTMNVTRKGRNMLRSESGVRICRRVMNCKRFPVLRGLLLFACLMIPVPAHPQAWSGILDPSRATDWTKSGITGGIPNYTHVCSTVSPSGDTTGSVDRTNINNALSSCAASASSSSPQVVLLAAGTFYANADVGPPAGSNDLVLRGSGPDKTIIKWVGTSAACGRGSGVDLCIQGNNKGQESGTTAWNGTDHSIGTYSQRSSVLDLASTSALAAGMIINLTQRDDAMGLCPQSGGVGNCSHVIGLTNDDAGTVTAVTSAPYSALTVGAEVYIGTSNNHSMDGACGGYQSGPRRWTVLTATTTASNTTFTYRDPNRLSSPTANCQPIYAAVDNGGVFTCSINAACVNSNAFAGTACPDAVPGNQCAPGEYSHRSQAEGHIIEAVCTKAGSPVAQCLAANEVVIDGQVIAPNYRASQSPGVWWTGSGANKFSDHVGIENLTVDATHDGTAFATVEFSNCTNFWYKNVRSINTYTNHVALVNSTRGSIVDSYIYGTQHSGPSSYGINLVSNASYILLQNNIVQHVVSGIQAEQAYGNVIAYNYFVDDHYAMSNAMISMSPTNHGFAGAELFEGNDTNQCQSNSAHGTSWAITYFRNRCRGQDTPPRRAGNSLLAVVDTAMQRGQNFVGNILGTSGFQSTYVQSSQIPFFPSQGIYWLNTSAGYIENGPGQVPLALDLAVTNTLLRWGNYDVATGAVRWCGNSSSNGWSTVCSSTSEIPTSAVAYINGNPVPSSTALPSSFYLSARPQFWTMASTYGSTPPWPAIGPDVTGGTAPDGVGGFSYPIPAQLCYQNTAADPNYQNTYTVSNVRWSSGTATLATGTNALAVGNTILVSGVQPSGYNGTWQVTAVTPNSVSFALPNNLGVHLSEAGVTSPIISGGTVTSPNILLFNAAKCYSAAYGGTAVPAPPTKVTAVAR
jgi:hypothetical protein